jgi:hypothetical protein
MDFPSFQRNRPHRQAAGKKGLNLGEVSDEVDRRG